MIQLRRRRDIAFGLKCDFDMKVAKLPICDPIATSHKSRKEIAIWHVTFFIKVAMWPNCDVAATSHFDKNATLIWKSPSDLSAMSRRRRNCNINAKRTKIINFEVARHISVTATEDAPWIFEVFIADHCAFVRLRLTEICMATSTPSRLATAEPAFRKIWNRHYSIGQLCDKKADEVYISPQHGMLAFVVILFGSQWGRSDVAATFPRPHCDIAHKSQEGRKGCKLRCRSDIAFRQQCDFYKSPNGFSAT